MERGKKHHHHPPPSPLAKPSRTPCHRKLLQGTTTLLFPFTIWTVTLFLFYQHISACPHWCYFHKSCWILKKPQSNLPKKPHVLGWRWSCIILWEDDHRPVETFRERQEPKVWNTGRKTSTTGPPSPYGGNHKKMLHITTVSD